MLLALILPPLLLGAFSSLHHSIPKLLFSVSFSTQDISLCLHCVLRNRHRAVATLHVYCFIFTLLIADNKNPICRMIRIILSTQNFIDPHAKILSITRRVTPLAFIFGIVTIHHRLKPSDDFEIISLFIRESAWTPTWTWLIKVDVRMRNIADIKFQVCR